MSKSKLKADDIFFNLQRTMPENETKQQAEPATQAQPELTKADAEPEKPATSVQATTDAQQTQAPTAATVTAETKKRGPVADPSNANRLQMNIKISPETKYSINTVINEMKMQGIKTRYTINDFVVEAIEEKLEKAKSELGIN